MEPTFDLDIRNLQPPGNLFISVSGAVDDERVLATRLRKIVSLRQPNVLVIDLSALSEGRSAATGACESIEECVLGYGGELRITALGADA